MRILFVAAVEFELNAVRSAWGGCPADYLLGGWGAEPTRRTLESAFAAGARYDLVVDAGIAGGRPGGPAVGDVVQVVAEQWGDRPGVLLQQPVSRPALDFLPRVTGNTVPALDDRFRQVTYDIETMEGAAFFEACLRQGCGFAEIRAVSNVVGERDHTRWNIPLALQSLQQALETYKKALSCY
ncbi:MAG: hypothetical protein J5478_00480 [Bacteroidales bacterium]|nr:hypothetical protein [Bacteroidales bacterium]